MPFQLLTLEPDAIPVTYISFATPGQFLGAVVIATTDFAEAIQRAVDLGLYPGGEAACFLVPSGMYPLNKLLTMADLPNATSLHELPEDAVELVMDNCVQYQGECIRKLVQ